MSDTLSQGERLGVSTSARVDNYLQECRTKRPWRGALLTAVSALMPTDARGEEADGWLLRLACAGG